MFPSFSDHDLPVSATRNNALMPHRLSKSFSQNATNVCQDIHIAGFHSDLFDK
jgi:hypothetical protein